MKDSNKGLFGLVLAAVFSAVVLVGLIVEGHLNDFIGVLSSIDITGFFVFVGLVLGLGSQGFVSRQFKAVVFMGGLMMALAQVVSVFLVEMPNLSTNTMQALSVPTAAFFIVGLCLLGGFSIWSMRRHIFEAKNQD